MSSVLEGKKPPGGSMSHFWGVTFSFFLNIYSMYKHGLSTMYTKTNLLNIRANCGSAEQPLLGPSEKL